MYKFRAQYPFAITRFFQNIVIFSLKFENGPNNLLYPPPKTSEGRALKMLMIVCVSSITPQPVASKQLQCPKSTPHYPMLLPKFWRKNKCVGWGVMKRYCRGFILQLKANTMMKELVKYLTAISSIFLNRALLGKPNFRFNCIWQNFYVWASRDTALWAIYSTYNS